MLDGKAIKPLYEQLKEKLENDIAEGKYKPGEKLLPEVEMAKKYNVSVITVRKATDELSIKGLLEKRQGKGTFVASRKYYKDLNQVISFSESCKMIGAVPGAKVLMSELVVPSKDILDQMELSLDSKTVYISRLRLVDKVPMVIENNHFPLKYSFLLEEDLDNNSVFNILKEKCGTQIVRSRRTIEICRASALEASHLNVKRNSPLLLVQGVVYGLDNEIVYVGSQIINGERYKLYV
ncbi:GntR family transcriptional regulator [Bacillus sp. REN16]|uniref:GntR family transcriptional regulator n=1 Tax=Bacillus sp. REN16 TaxID=2887296 RepID=UPI001E2EC0EB|nr:GntR family transcriptional regulator [Bacillus sp. REN16]MCC3358944.1 GntR family transcriptional regulator [Bacillus sp. REN16]